MDKKRRVKANIQNLHLATTEDLMRSDTLIELLIRETPISIEYALENKSSYATLFEINESASFIQLHKRDWINALESCLKHHLEKENYEACSKINVLINKIKRKNSRITVKSEKNE